MSFLYPVAFVLLLPLYFLYKKHYVAHKYTKREKRFLFLALAFIFISLTRPVVPNALNKQKFDAQDFIVAIDASYSMQAKDLLPSRYEVAKKSLKEIIQTLPKNRFSLFAFTSNAILISPPTTDTAISIMALEALKPKYILTKGTSLLTLMKTIAKTSFKQKNLIIFTDGGEDRNLDALLTLAKKNNIIPYIVATGSKSGAILIQGDKRVKDGNNNLVISRINPLLKDFATLSGGKYYSLDTINTDVTRDIIYDINSLEEKSRNSEINVLSYTELFQIPLFIAILFFVMAVTKIHQLYVLIPLLFLPHQAKAGIFDFYHIFLANEAYEEHHYLESSQEFYLLSPSVESYYNEAVTRYKAKKYRTAADIFSKIKTTDPKIKQKIYYNLGNCAVMYKKFDRAKIYYQNALAFGYDKDSYENLKLIYELQLIQKLDLTKMMPKQVKDIKNTASEKDNVKKDKEKKKTNSSSKSNQKSATKSNGSSNSKKIKIKEAKKKTNETIESKYKVGYKAYELINKGYTNEKHPW